MTTSPYHHDEPNGYIRCHRKIKADCGVMAAVLYGILEDLFEIGTGNGQGCYPSHEYLAQELGVNERSVRYYLKDLREKGWLTWEAAGRSNVYTLHTGVPQPRQNNPVVLSTPVNNAGKPRQNKPSTPVKFTDKLNVYSNQREQPPPTPPPPAAAVPAAAAKGGYRYTQEFDEFWVLVLRKEPSKSEGFKAYTKALRRASAEEIAAGMRRWLPYYESLPDRTKVPHITTWLNQDRWTVASPTLSGPTPNGMISEAELQEFSDRVDRIRGGHV